MCWLITPPRMNTLEIERAITQDPCAEAVFAGVYAKDCLPDTVRCPCAMVWNTDPADEPGEHWVAVYFDENGRGEYFDLYGQPPLACFKQYMKRHSIQWVCSKRPLQDVWTSACC